MLAQLLCWNHSGHRLFLQLKLLCKKVLVNWITIRSHHEFKRWSCDITFTVWFDGGMINNLPIQFGSNINRWRGCKWRVFGCGNIWFDDWLVLRLNGCNIGIMWLYGVDIRKYVSFITFLELRFGGVLRVGNMRYFDSWSYFVFLLLKSENFVARYRRHHL